MAVRVRMFAAVREAAGTGETTVPPGPLDAALDVLRDRYGPVFAQRLAVSTVLVDGQAIPRDATRVLPDGTELVILPPVSGGAGQGVVGRDEDLGATAGAIASGVLGVAVLAALLVGPGMFGAVVVAVAVLLVLDLSGVLARTGSRPVVLAAALPGVGLPAAVAFSPAAGWDDIPAFFAITLGVAFLLVLVFGRRQGVTAGVGATLVVSLVVGLGGAGLLLLLDLADGFRWVLGFLVTVAAADAGGPLGQRALEGRGRALVAAARPLGSLLSVVVAATAVALTLDPPFTPLAATLIGGVTLVARIGGEDLGRAIVLEAGSLGRPRRLLGHGLVAGSARTVLLGAPAVYILARGIGVS